MAQEEPLDSDISPSLTRVFEMDAGLYRLERSAVVAAVERLGEETSGRSGQTRLAFLWTSLVWCFIGDEDQGTMLGTSQRKISQIVNDHPQSDRMRLDRSRLGRRLPALGMAVRLATRDEQGELRAQTAKAQREHNAAATSAKKDQAIEALGASLDRHGIEEAWEDAFTELFSMPSSDGDPRRAEAVKQLVTVLSNHPDVLTTLSTTSDLTADTVAEWLCDDAKRTLIALLELDDRDVAKQLACAAVPQTPQWADCLIQVEDTVPNWYTVKAVDEPHADIALSNMVGAFADLHGTPQGLASRRQLAVPASTQADLRLTPDRYLEALCSLLADNLQTSVRGMDREEAVAWLRGSLRVLKDVGYRDRDFRYLVESHEVGGSVAKELPELWVVTMRRPKKERLMDLGGISMLLRKLFG